MQYKVSIIWLASILRITTDTCYHNAEFKSLVTHRGNTTIKRTLKISHILND